MANHREVLDRHWQRLLGFPNVLNTAVGTKVKNGEDTKIPAIVVYVSKKVKEVELAAEHIIPKELEGVPTDVMEFAPKTWKAGKTSISQLHPEEQRKRLGVLPKTVSKEKPKSVTTGTTTQPSGQSDWTAYANPIQDQASCGSCLSFDITGVWEALIKIVTGEQIKLSESHLFFCGGGYCRVGSMPEDLLNQALKGVCLESCLPYDTNVQAGNDEGCGQGICANWWLQAKKLKEWQAISDPTQILVLLDSGPLVATMGVPQSFLNYQCYSEDTEILTEHGWKRISALTVGECVATLENNTLVYSEPLNYFDYPFSGELWHLSSMQLDFLVTPNHNMYARLVDWHSSCKNFDSFELVPLNRMNRSRVTESLVAEAVSLKAQGHTYQKVTALLDRRDPHTTELYLRGLKIPAQDSIPEGWEFKKDAAWLGIEQQYFTLPEVKSDWVIPAHHNGRGVVPEVKRHYYAPALQIDMDAWLEFLGYYLSEGHCYNNDGDYKTGIAQEKSAVRDKIEDCLKKLPWHYRADDSGFTISDKQLYEYLKQFGKAHDKYIPREILALSERQLGIIFKALMLGDGYGLEVSGRPYKANDGYHSGFSYFSVSKRLADDVQELSLKIGLAANVTPYSSKSSEIIHRVGIIQNHLTPAIGDNNKIEKVQYEGRVYCVEVPSHVVYVRRNGKAAWCGNSGIYNRLANDPIIGRHGIGCFGYFWDCFKIIRNSWGPGWGQNCVINGVPRPGWCMIDPNLLDPVQYQLTPDGPVPEPNPPTPSPCKWGNLWAKFSSKLFLLKERHRKGRFYYRNP
jgi:hypothetical protein